MGIEDNLFNMFKYMNRGKAPDPVMMIRAMMDNLEISLLKQMQNRINVRLDELGVNEEIPYDDLDPFIILGVTRESNKEEVSKAYKQRAWEAHPDHGGSNMDMAKVNTAYEVIKQFKGWK